MRQMLIVFYTLFQPHELTIAYCNSGNKNNMSIVQCCNDSNYCNHDIQLKLPMETEGYPSQQWEPPRPSPPPRQDSTSTPAWSESGTEGLGGRNIVH